MCTKTEVPEESRIVEISERPLAVFNGPNDPRISQIGALVFQHRYDTLFVAAVVSDLMNMGLPRDAIAAAQSGGTTLTQTEFLEMARICKQLGKTEAAEEMRQLSQIDVLSIFFSQTSIPVEKTCGQEPA
jgi:hypothetical protein